MANKSHNIEKKTKFESAEVIIIMIIMMIIIITIIIWFIMCWFVDYYMLDRERRFGGGRDMDGATWVYIECLFYRRDVEQVC